jgi:hypothetical protein
MGHETLLSVEQKRFKACKNAHAPFLAERRSASSFIRTVTVGSSIELDLLTFAHRAVCEALAGSRPGRPCRLPPVGNSTPP